MFVNKRDVVRIVKAGASDEAQKNALLALAGDKPSLWDGLDEEDVLGVLKQAITQLETGLFTLKQVVSCPLPVLEARLNPRSSNSKTAPSAARTFTNICPWSEFLIEAGQLEESLDDTRHVYNKVCHTYTPGLGISSPADECEGRGALVTVLQSINDAARILDIGAECVGGGSGRSLSFTDLIVRKRGQPSNPQQLSALVLGAGEVKGAWQLDLQCGDKLEDMLRDPARIDTCVMALQQAYGDAVIDEAPLLFVSNYHCTVFLKRSQHVHDKKLWASEPIWWDRQHPSAPSCWLRCLRAADEMQAQVAKDGGTSDC